MNEETRTKYQGREFTAILHAPDEKTLNNMIEAMEHYAKRYEMGHVQVLQRGVDPDGGYRAVVVAHNFNPFRWLKRKIEKRGKSEDEKLRLDRYYRREDAVRNAEAQRKKQRKHEEKLAKMQRKTAEKAEKAKQRESEAKIRAQESEAEAKARKAKATGRAAEATAEAKVRAVEATSRAKEAEAEAKIESIEKAGEKVRQGKEFTTILQAPDKTTLDDMEADIRKYATSFDIDDVKILRSGVDPDGGYQTVIAGHNTNPERKRRRVKAKGRVSRRKVNKPFTAVSMRY